MDGLREATWLLSLEQGLQAQRPPSMTVHVKRLLWGGVSVTDLQPMAMWPQCAAPLSSSDSPAAVLRAQEPRDDPDGECRLAPPGADWGAGCRQGMQKPIHFATVVTDLTTCHNAWFHRGVSRCFVPTAGTLLLAIPVSFGT